MSRDLGLSTNWIFGIFSASLVISAVMGRRSAARSTPGGGNGVLAGFEPAVRRRPVPAAACAFPADACRRLGGDRHRHGPGPLRFRLRRRSAASMAPTRAGAITGITLLAGFASTIGWPLTAWGAVDHRLARDLPRLGGGPPLHRPAAELVPAAAPRRVTAATTTAQRAADQADADRPSDDPARPSPLPRPGSSPRAWPPTSRASSRPTGASPAQAIAAGALIGPAQVAARLLEAGPLRALPSAGLGAPRDAHASDRRRGHPAGRRRRRVERLRRPARLGQRHPHHRARDGAARAVRAGELRLSPRPPRRAGALPAGRRALGFSLLIEQHRARASCWCRRR